MITQFLGEDRRDAIINHFSLDMEEEDSFFDLMDEVGLTPDSDDELIEDLHDSWRKLQ